MIRSSTNSRRRPAIVLAVALLLAAFLAGCGSGDGPGGDADALAAQLPEDGALGQGWQRVSGVRIGADAESSGLCDSGLDDGVAAGAKVDFARGEDFASAYFRSYADPASADRAFARAAERIGRCSSSEGLDVRTVAAPAAGDAAYSAVFSAPGADPAAEAALGWTLVRTGSVVRSLQFIPAAEGSGLDDDLGQLTAALAG